MKAGESRREAPTREELPEFALHESRQAFAVPQRTRLGAERLKVIANDLIERALRRIAGLVRDGGFAHAAHARTRAACHLNI